VARQHVVNPGQSLTITPPGTPGSVVAGTIYLADSSLVSGEVTYSEL
jgi:hypothetical protein